MDEFVLLRIPSKKFVTTRNTYECILKKFKLFAPDVEMFCQSSKLTIPLENGRIYIVNISILTIGEGNVMFISDHKVFGVICFNGVYGPVKGKISGRLV